MIDYEKRIMDRLNTLKSELAELKHPKLTKQRNMIQEFHIVTKINELENLLA